MRIAARAEPLRISVGSDPDRRNDLRLRRLSRETCSAYDDAPGDGAFSYAGVGAVGVLYAGGSGADRFGGPFRGSGAANLDRRIGFGRGRGRPRGKRHGRQPGEG